MEEIEQTSCLRNEQSGDLRRKEGSVYMESLAATGLPYGRTLKKNVDWCLLPLKYNHTKIQINIVIHNHITAGLVHDNYSCHDPFNNIMYNK